MILANAKGREVVEELWPDVQWENDELFSSVHSPDWSFTHICVTKLPPHLETQIPLAFASPDAIGFAVAMALQRIAEPKRVAHYTGEGDGLTLNFYDGAEACGGRDLALSLFAEYVPSGPVRPDHPESAN
jgi:hypothetical protein